MAWRIEVMGIDSVEEGRSRDESCSQFWPSVRSPMNKFVVKNIASIIQFGLDKRLNNVF